MSQIAFAIEPNRLKLIWQSSGENRKKFVVGELVRSDQSISLSYFRLSNDFFEALRVGFAGHPAFDISYPVHHHNVIEVFSKRIPPRNRTDFIYYLQNHRLERFPNLSNFALLGYTGAYLPGDGFSFAIDFSYQNLPFQFLMEISGFRYYQGMSLGISDLVGNSAFFIPEPENVHDSSAVKIYISGMHIGYVPRYYSSIMNYWMNYCDCYAVIEKVDGALSKPQVYLVMTIYPKSGNQLT